MKTYVIRYTIKKNEYTTKVMATSLKIAKHKLSVAHKCVDRAIKIIECEEV